MQHFFDQKVLLVRMDKIGDLVLSLSLDQAPELKGAKVHWYVCQGLEFILESTEPRREFTSFSKNWSWQNFFLMVSKLRELKPDIALVLYAPWWMGLALWVARVPLRIGRKSQWHSFLFFNKGIRQSRSQSEFHESDYNYHLLSERKSVGALPALSLKANGSLPKDLETALIPNEFYLVHPGMAGSAMNWPSFRYVELIERLAERRLTVITGTAADSPFLQPIQLQLSTHPRILWLNERLTGPELLLVLSRARAVIAPSTGILHLAASLGRPALGIYSPRRQESVQRWGPKGQQVATISAPQELATAEATMAQISTQQVLTLLEHLLKGSL